MCGIFAVVNEENYQAGKTVLEGLKKLEYRGYDSWGVVVKIKNDTLFVDKHIGKISEAKVVFPKGSIALGHTRWATHGGVTDANAHPHLDCTKKIAVTHNGIVENHRELREFLKQKGHKFVSETDTEVIAHLIEEEGKNKPIIKAVFSAFKKIIGSNAIAVLDSENDLIISCRNGSPLVVGVGNKEFFLASDVTPFLHKTNKVFFVNDGEGVVLGTKKLELYDLKSERQKVIKLTKVNWKIEDAQKSGYPHFLLKEIIEQKYTIPKTSKLNEVKIKSLAKKINKGYSLVILGCGTAAHCSMASKYFFANVGINTQAYGAYEFLPFAKFCTKKTIVIAISQSGETADTLIAVKTAKIKGAYIVSLVNAMGSSLERLADCTLSVGAGPEIAVVSTKAFTSQLATLYLLAKACKKEYLLARGKLLDLGKVLQLWLSHNLQKKILSLAKSLVDEEDIYVIGKHINSIGAMEFALKIKETSYIHAEAFASGELKHGVISLIQKNVPCIVLANNDELKREILASAMEIKARGGRIIGIAPFEAQEFDQIIKTPDMQELCIFANIIIGQLLGYYLGIGRGADPDKPRNLAKSVTVK